MTVPVDPVNDGWQGTPRYPTGEFSQLLSMLRDLDRRLAALERAAPGRVSGLRMWSTGVEFEKNVTATAGTVALGSSTTIAGVGMGTFITQQQATRSEVIAARGTWPDIGTRMTQISAKADDALGDASDAMSAASAAQGTANAVQSEVVTARGGSGSLNGRLNTLATSASVTSLASSTSSALSAISSYLSAVRSAIISLGGSDPGVPP